MLTHDVVQIVDVYPHNPEKKKQSMKIDPDGEAQSLSMVVNVLGRAVRKIAIVAKEDDRRLLAYQRAGYETHPMNSRPAELRQFIRHMIAQIKQINPKHTVLVSDDPEFSYLCEAVTQHTSLSVWAHSATVPRELMEPAYGFRPLEEVVRIPKTPRIDVRIDLENIFIGLVQRGWTPNLRKLVNAIRQALEGLGEIVAITGYADWGALNKHHGGPNIDWQRELTMAGGESRYVVNQHGKNTADMKVVDDIRTLVEHEHSAAGAIDIIALATMDRDFRHIVETTKTRGKRVVLLALKGGLSHHLEGVAHEIRYLDDLLVFKPETPPPAPPKPEDVALAMRIAVLMHKNRWSFAYRDRLEQEFDAEGETLKRLIEQSWLTSTANSPTDANGQARMLEANTKNPHARAAFHLARRIPERVDFCLRKAAMPYVDSNYLASGMVRDPTLQQLGVARTRTAAENWLQAVANAGLIVATQRPHPQSPTKMITTWTLPDQQPTAEADIPTVPTIETTPMPPTPPAPPISIPVIKLRQVLTKNLSDAELTRLLFDHFREVHVQVGEAAKHVRIQALLEHVELRNRHQELITAIKGINETLAEDTWEQPIAA